MKKLAAFVFFLLFAITISFGQSFATLYGRIADWYGNSIENVVVYVENSDIISRTDGAGKYKIVIPANSQLNVKFQYGLYIDTVISVFLGANEQKEKSLVFFIKSKLLDIIYVEAKYEDNYIRIDPKLNYKIPTPGGSIESLIKLMPGVSSSNELSSQYSVRGGNFDENLIYVNDIEVYKPFLVRNAQQEGMSFINLALTSGVKFSAGGFEAKYGDKISSVLDVEYKHPVSYSGSLMASILGASAHVEGVVKEKFSFLAGIRYRSNAYILKSLDTKGDYKPRFFDTQMLLSWKPIKKLEVNLLGIFSNNSYLQQPTDRETALGTIASSKKLFVLYDGQEVDSYESYLGALTFNYYINNKNKLKLIFSSYYASEQETYDILSRYNIREIEADLGSSGNTYVVDGPIIGTGAYREHARNFLTAIVSAADLRGDHKIKNLTLSWGTKIQNEIINDYIKEWSFVDSSGYILPNTETNPGDSVPYDDPSRLIQLPKDRYLFSENSINTFRISAFAQVNWNIDGDSAARFKLNMGIRCSYWTFNNETTISPRIIFSYRPQTKADLLFLLKTGLYYQPAFYREMRNFDGELNKEIKAQRSAQIIAAAEYNFKLWRRAFKLTAEAYYKYLDRLVSYDVENVKIVYSGMNDAKGYATGLDIKWSGEFIEGLESWVSLSLMKTAADRDGDKFRNRDGSFTEPGYIPRPTDQNFAINIFFQDHLPKLPSFRVHLNFIFASPLPANGSLRDPNTALYKDDNGKLHSSRLSWYRRVDIGFSYMFLEQTRDKMRNKTKFAKTINNMGIFAEVFNLLNTNNVSSKSWFSLVGNVSAAVPNYLTGRLFNLKFLIEF